ncbi:helix-turn-helix domain-containing protein [Desulfovibrio sp.]|uniref:helix-turn-helix domain-containing protein n=1 Tax=Desulfovibrio sp. TaxID=885 RepID=UPI00257B86FA|nr:helix-turn-helix domain-containing protein [Desulfovibrio sp.]MBR2610067.1 helix-turn-helix domain-containing protein [Desulfovibrio sp.]
MKQSMYKSKEELPMFLTVMDVANLLGISRASAYELVREDNFPKLKIVQGRTIIPRDRLIEWLDEQTRYDELPR